MSTRTINHQKYNVPEIVANAIVAADAKSLNLEKARDSLKFLGHQNPTDELVRRYARETAILKVLSEMTQANFSGQIGKISFDNIDQTIADVNSYLNRRIHGQHVRWTERH